MRYLPLLALLLVIPACTQSLRISSSGVTSSGNVRDPITGASAGVHADRNGVHTSSSGPGWSRYQPPVIHDNIGGAHVSINTRNGDVTTSDRLGPFFVRGDNDGVRLGADVDRWKFCDACYDSGVSFYVDSNDGVHVSEPNPHVYNDYVRAGLKDGHFDVAWRGVGFEKALDSLNGVIKVRLDASASEDGFKVSAVPSVRMTLLDVSADYAAHRLAAHAGLHVYVNASEEYVLRP